MADSPNGVDQPGDKRRRVQARTVAGAAVVALVTALGTVAVTSGNGNSGSAEAASAVLYVAPNCDVTTEACQAAKLAALEQWAIAQGGTLPTPTPSSTPSTATPTPTTASPTPTPTPTTTVAPPAGQALIGMSAPANLWAQRIQEVGPGIQARRIFLNTFTSSLALPAEACAAGMTPIVSFKTGTYSWAQVAGGAADVDLRALAVKLNALTCPAFVAIHHEPAVSGHPPAGEAGTPAQWAAMNVHALPILGGPLGGKVTVGVVGNGWWFVSGSQGYSDAEMAQWLTPALRAVVDVIASDTYASTGGGPAAQMRNMASWRVRVGYSGKLGVGEFNSASAADVTAAMNELKSNAAFAWGCVWNSTGGTFVPLTGDRLVAFREALAAW